MSNKRTGQGVQPRHRRNQCLHLVRKSVFQTAQSIVSHEGVRGLWRGTNATLIRNVPGIALYMTSLNHVRAVMATSPYFSNVSAEASSKHSSVLPTLTSQGNLVAGATARVAVGFLLNPFSVLKARYEVRLHTHHPLTRLTFIRRVTCTRIHPYLRLWSLWCVLVHRNF